MLKTITIAAVAAAVASTSATRGTAATYLPASPESLCPEAMPEDWKDPCRAGDLLFDDGSSSNPTLPAIGNGFLATFVGSDVVYSAGLFNGDSLGSLGAVSHRATIPAFHVTADGSAQSSRALDLRQAAFLKSSTLNGGSVELSERWYATLDRPNVLVHDMNFSIASDGPSTSVPQTVHLSSSLASMGNDLNLTEIPNQANRRVWTGTNYHGELGNATALAMIVTDPSGMTITVSEKPVTLTFLTVIVTSLNSTSPLKDADDLYSKAAAIKDELFETHASAWADRWNAGSLEVEGDLGLAQSLNASLYAIRSSIRADWPYGLSPGGLASNGYSGHTFWDQETWMWPPLLMLDPTCAASALEYRFNRMDHAHSKAIQAGTDNHASSGGQGQLSLSSDALMFPWESCLTGAEVQNSNGKIGPWGEYEQHISGDIALAVRQYYYASGDKDWLRSRGFPLVKGIADFYAKRAVPNNESGRYDINIVMGPDEYAYPVNNSAYTNAVATIALDFATEAAGVLWQQADPLWSTVASGLRTLLVNETVPNRPDLQGGYHPEYQGFPKDPSNPKVKQADTVMLSFPLGVDMQPEVLSNDLDFYDGVTDPNGPAMTWAIFAIGWINVGNFTRSQPHFTRQLDNIKGPFRVWQETPNGGTTNFITGAGGFIQSVLFGTSGLRIKQDGLYFTPPPPNASGTNATAFGLNSIHFRGRRLSQRVTADRMWFKVEDGSQDKLVLELERDGSRHDLNPGDDALEFERESAIIREP